MVGASRIRHPPDLEQRLRQDQKAKAQESVLQSAGARRGTNAARFPRWLSCEVRRLQKREPKPIGNFLYSCFCFFIWLFRDTFFVVFFFRSLV